LCGKTLDAEALWQGVAGAIPAARLQHWSLAG